MVLAGVHTSLHLSLLVICPIPPVRLSSQRTETTLKYHTFGVNYNRFGYQVSTFTGMKYVDAGRYQLVIFEDLEGISCSVAVNAKCAIVANTKHVLLAMVRM
jgi:hypothetical protein